MVHSINQSTSKYVLCGGVDMYKIVELNEREINQFRGKIIQIIDTTKKDCKVHIDFGPVVTVRMWVLVCLVEVEEWAKE